MKLLLVSALIAISPTARACTIVYGEYKVGPDFRVKVEKRGQPAQGAVVKIQGASATTDKNGFAFFHQVPPGSNFISVDVLTGIPDGAYLKVSSDGPAAITIPLQLPDIEPISVLSLKGSIRASDFYYSNSQRPYSLELIDGHSKRKLATSQTNSRGEFAFRETKPGLYAIAVDRSGQIVVEVTPGARVQELDIDIGMTSCGLYYLDRSQCPHAEMRMERLSGQVIDSSGASVPNAKIELLDSERRSIEDIRSDGQGMFSSLRNLVGSYELLIRSPGFSPYRGIVHLDAENGADSKTSITITLGIGGSCGTQK